MSSIHEIDPRLRDTSSQPLAVLPQRPTNSNSNLQTLIAANTDSTSSVSPLSQHQQYHPIHDPTPRQTQTQNENRNPYLTHTPQSVGNAADQDVGDGTHDGGPNDPKRPRACEACRGLKVRCEPDPNNPDGACKRCAKAGRQCVVTQPSRKRQKKSDSRIAELEKKVSTLTATLQARNTGSVIHSSENGLEDDGLPPQVLQNPYQQVTNGSFNQHVSPYAAHSQPSGNDWPPYAKSPEEGKNKGAPMVVAGQKRKHIESRDFSTSGSPNAPGSQLRKPDDGGALIGQIHSAWASFNPDPNVPKTHEYSDVIDRRILTAEMANQIFDCYVEKMALHMPAVVFPAGTLASKVRKETPTLFLSILAAGSGSNFPDLQRVLTKEIMAIYAERIIVNGDKSLELVQALHVSTLWYWPPEHFEELKFYQLIHIAAVMALDVGMGKSTKSGKFKNAGLFRDNPWRKQPFPDPESIEARRAWLTCYFLCCNTSMGLRRPNLIRWSSFMENCIDVLENSPDAAPTDKLLCQWIRSQHIAEEIGNQFSMDDPAAKVSISDPKVQYALKGFEHDLEKWNSQVPVEAQSHSLKMTEHVVNLYMHEIAMHVDHNVDEFKPPYSEETLRGLGDGSTDEVLTPHHIAALSACLQSIDGIFEIFLGFEVEIVRCLPVANFVRVAYAVVVLIKMYFAASTPNSGVGKVFDKNNMRVEEYLDRLVTLFNASSAENKSRPSAKFLMVLVMLKTWFHRQKNGKAQENQSHDPGTAMTLATDSPAAAKSEVNQNPNGQQQNKQGYGPANTPLQLLSEVATGNSRGQHRTDNQYSGSSDGWQQLQQPQLQFQNYGAVNQMPPTNYMGSNIDPSLGNMDLNYTMGEGFEQAMGLTMAGLDAYLSDDTFFSGMVGSGPGFDGF